MHEALRQLKHELKENPARGRSYEILSHMANKCLARAENTEVLTFEAINLLAECGTYAEQEMDPKDWVPAVGTIRKALSRLQQLQSSNRLQLGYSSGGGRGVVSLYWLELEKSEALENEASNESNSLVSYRRTPKGSIKPSLAAKLFLRNGEMRNRSPRGITFLISILLGAILWAALLGILLAALGMRDGPVSIGNLITVGLAIMGFGFGWQQIYAPWFKVVDDCVVKAPLWVTALMEDECELEMFRHDRNRWTRLVRFTADCPICGGNISLKKGAPDQKQPLVGRCGESPHAHVYSFDRTTLKGSYLGPPIIITQ